MKPIRAILTATFVTLAIFTTVVYTACNKNHCKNVVCVNGGACDDGHCVCLIGYEGSRCELLSRDKFVFTYNGHDMCNSVGNDTVFQYPIHLLAMRTDSIELTMMGLLNNAQDSAVCVMRATDSFSFQGANNSTTYYGTGKLRNDSLWLTYHVEHDTSSYDCHYLGISLK